MIEAVAAMSAILIGTAIACRRGDRAAADQLVPDATGADAAAAPTFSQALHSALGRVDGTISQANASCRRPFPPATRTSR